MIQRLFATGLRLRRDRAPCRRLRPRRAARPGRRRPRPHDQGHPRHDLRAPEPAGQLAARGDPVAGAGVRAAAGLRPDVVTVGAVDTAVTPAVRDQLLPVLREALSNVARHASADHAEIEVRADAHELRLTVDGRRGRPRGRGPREWAAQRSPPRHRAPGDPRADRQRAARHARWCGPSPSPEPPLTHRTAACSPGAGGRSLRRGDYRSTGWRWTSGSLASRFPRPQVSPA